jgi:hypothetical protein
MVLPEVRRVVDTVCEDEETVLRLQAKAPLLYALLLTIASGVRMSGPVGTTAVVVNAIVLEEALELCGAIEGKGDGALRRLLRKGEGIT